MKNKKPVSQCRMTGNTLGYPLIFTYIPTVTHACLITTVHVWRALSESVHSFHLMDAKDGELRSTGIFITELSHWPFYTYLLCCICESIEDLCTFYRFFWFLFVCFSVCDKLSLFCLTLPSVYQKPLVDHQPFCAH